MNACHVDPLWTLYHGDALAVLKELPDESVHCCVTSPPYWGLRDYGVASQLGLEKTPDEYVTKMVEVFREVRRVLRDDGTLWINLGDSYNGYMANQRATSISENNQCARPVFKSGHGPRTRTMKPKDLIGIPWRVAFALQQPYYAGHIKNIHDRIWLAAIIDGEGCMFIHKRKAGSDSYSHYTKSDGTSVSYTRTQDTYGSGLEVANTSLKIVERCKEITGLGSICSQSPTQNNRRKQTIYRWNLRTNECRDLIRELYPHFIAKQHQARLLYACPSSGKEAELAHASMIALHRGYATQIDFQEPPSCFEKGWYLRSDVIWSKCNPMPESVTDRPTKSHEYIFLLSKSERYYYDAEAIKERQTESTRERAQYGWAGLTDDGSNGARTGSTFKRMAESGEKIATIPVDGFRNKRSVWTVATSPYPEAHFATYPPDLIKPCILAGCPLDGTVLDPFGGSGTTGQVALELGRKAVLIELNAAYLPLIQQRLGTTPGLRLG